MNGWGRVGLSEHVLGNPHTLGLQTLGSISLAPQVRQATVAVLKACALQELQRLSEDIAALSTSQPPSSVPGQASHLSAAGATHRVLRSPCGAERRQVAEQCAEYLCDLLVDEMPSVRGAASQALGDVLAAASSLEAPPPIPGGGQQQQRRRQQQIEERMAAEDEKAPHLGIMLLDARQMLVVIGALSDQSQIVRAESLRALAHMRLNTHELMWSFALGAAACWAACGRGPEQTATLAAVQQVASRSPALARTIATAIAQQHAHQRQAASVTALGYRGAATGPHVAGALDVGGQCVIVGKQHLVVMRELLYGSKQR